MKLFMLELILLNTYVGNAAVMSFISFLLIVSDMYSYMYDYIEI